MLCAPVSSSIRARRRASGSIDVYASRTNTLSDLRSIVSTHGVPDVLTSASTTARMTPGAAAQHAVTADTPCGSCCGRSSVVALHRSDVCSSRACDQRARPQAPLEGCPRRASRGGAPQGTRSFDERSDAKVYGATPFVAAKETTTLPKVHWGGRSRGNGSLSGESPKASWGAATKSVHPTIDVERGEA